MKVFISHSSKDKWIARKLSEELYGIGCQTFLDEKDIETGESIDESIHDHLGESDDFLLLLSPDSVKSHWVLIELGGALALKKRIVIILLYLGANDIPSCITRYLARDINDVDKYYDEVKKRMAGAPTAPVKKVRPRKVAPRRATHIKIGDKVKLISTPQNDTHHHVGWNPQTMDHLCGQVVTVAEVDEEMDYIQIEEDNLETYWALEWITPVEG